ncbi:hypothetical protein BP5796_08914 [Coleophoma crateriformis]|uniref:Uncharacterized protein n=1 Tax=Coleophoma crateriformis TaxID=565419 RepID=A0A3D8R2K0_9HELO|nr:hypothetical protein BP5796_08914 [Coleophoma crateriformis]
MRILDTETLHVRYKQAGERYAILSHVWGEEEVTFQDIQNLDNAQRMAGFPKLAGAASLAKSHGYDCIWIDTCCIDKTSSAELSEAINSMYEWYKKTDVCYAYLEDLNVGHSVQGSVMSVNIETSLRLSRWFRRGWTLQELIAPPNVEFYAKDWTYIGTRDALKGLISTITGIDIYMLEQGDPHKVSIARRMAWASGRQTTRKEDAAYCLMGLFGVNMPLLYGEGDKAFLRLQEEIMKVSGDQSLFVWSRSTQKAGYLYNRYNSFLAMSPDEFRFTGKSVPLLSDQSLGPTASIMTNRGIQIKLAVVPVTARKWGTLPDEPTHLGILAPPYGPSPGTFAAVRLLQLGDSSTFRRVGRDIDTVRTLCPPTPYIPENEIQKSFTISWLYNPQRDIIDSQTLPFGAKADWVKAENLREVTIVSNDHTDIQQMPPISVILGDEFEVLSAWPVGSWDPGTSTMFWPSHSSWDLWRSFECAFLIQCGSRNNSQHKSIGLCLELGRSVECMPPSGEIECISMKYFMVKETYNHENYIQEDNPKETERLLGLLRALENDTTIGYTIEHFLHSPPFELSLHGFGVPGQVRLILNVS